ncbi:MAG: glycosyltransferase family 4 protein [Chloroflexi bacterium]|nr:glycosyltransferase family 4 protein [Chloroflexota bacterium]
MDRAPLRVLFLTPYFRPYLGGIERAIEQLSFQMQQSSAIEAVGVLTTKYSFPRLPQPTWADRETTPEGISIYRLSGFPRRSIPLYSVPLVWFSPLRLKKYLDEFRPDVIHFVGDGWFWGHLWAWFWYRGRARFVFTPSYHTLPISRWWLKPINAFLCRVADRVVALTSLEAKGVHRAYLAPKDKLGVIGWGASIEGPRNPAEAKGAPVPEQGQPQLAEDRGGEAESKPLTVLCVGRLGDHKGQLWLLDTYLQARAEFKHPVRMVLVGRDEGGAAGIEKYIAQHNLQGEVVVTGEVSDGELDQWYAEADLFTLFSRYEAFGLVFLEAMAHGVPVLTHDVGANREVLQQGAVVGPRFDREAATRELIRLVNDDTARRELGREAQRYALAEFTWPAVAKKYLDIYQQTRTAA